MILTYSSIITSLHVKVAQFIWLTQCVALCRLTVKNANRQVEALCHQSDIETLKTKNEIKGLHCVSHRGQEVTIINLFWGFLTKPWIRVVDGVWAVTTKALRHIVSESCGPRRWWQDVCVVLLPVCRHRGETKKRVGKKDTHMTVNTLSSSSREFGPSTWV